MNGYGHFLAAHLWFRALLGSASRSRCSCVARAVLGARHGDGWHERTRAARASAARAGAACAGRVAGRLRRRRRVDLLQHHVLNRYVPDDRGQATSGRLREALQVPRRCRSRDHRRQGRRRHLSRTSARVDSAGTTRSSTRRRSRSATLTCSDRDAHGDRDSTFAPARRVQRRRGRTATRIYMLTTPLGARRDDGASASTSTVRADGFRNTAGRLRRRRQRHLPRQPPDCCRASATPKARARRPQRPQASTAWRRRPRMPKLDDESARQISTARPRRRLDRLRRPRCRTVAGPARRWRRATSQKRWTDERPPLHRTTGWTRRCWTSSPSCRRATRCKQERRGTASRSRCYHHPATSTTSTA